MKAKKMIEHADPNQSNQGRQLEQENSHDEITQLFLAVKEECERDHCLPTSLDEIEKEIMKEPDPPEVGKPQETEVFSFTTKEVRNGITFKIVGMGPKRCFKKNSKEKKKNPWKKLREKPEKLAKYLQNYIKRSLVYLELKIWSQRSYSSGRKKILVNKKISELKRVNYKQMVQDYESDIREIDVKIPSPNKDSLKQYVQDNDRQTLEDNLKDPVMLNYLLKKFFDCNQFPLKQALARFKRSESNSYECGLDILSLEEKLNDSINYIGW